MAGKRQNIPQDSEVPVREWLKQIGATDIRYVGDGDGPPDFLVRYREEEIAVEVTLLHDSDGWDRTKKYAFGRELGHLIKEISKEENAPKWHARCEYDSREPHPPSKNGTEWKEKVRKVLRTRGGGGKFQLLSPGQKRGRGVILELWPASNEGSFLENPEEDDGCITVPVLAERIAAGVEEKAKKVRQGRRAKAYEHWWLVFDDEVLVRPVRELSEDERAIIEARVRECAGREQWNKIVLMSRFQTTPSPPKRPKWFYAPWEDHEHPALPVSPS